MASYEPVPRFSQEAGRTDATENMAPPTATTSAPRPRPDLSSAENAHASEEEPNAFTPPPATVTNEPPQECGKETSRTEPTDALDVSSGLGEALLNTQPAHAAFPFWKRIGITGCLLLAPGSLIILIVLALLAKVWSVAIAAAEGSVTDMPWLYILESDRTSSLVTICTAIIRTIVTLQFGIATAMLASLIIERVGAPLWHIPLLSILRATASTPTSLLSAVARVPRRQDRSLFTIQGIIILELLLVLSIQFFSTILLFDFGNTSIRGSSTEAVVMIEPESMFLLSEFWSFPTTIGYTFAEKSETFVRGTDFEDTGHTYRAFVPFLEETDRLALRWYNGPAVVMDNQVACLSPSLDSLHLTPNGILEGYVSWEEHSSFVDNGALERTPFRCQVPGAFGWRAGGICFLDAPSWKGTLRDTLVPPLKESEALEPYMMEEETTSFMRNGSRIILSFLSTDLDDILAAVSFDETALPPHQVTGQDGPWTIIGNSTLETTRISACLTGLGTDIYNVSMERSREASEPKVTMNSQHIESTNIDEIRPGGGDFFKTADARRQLGAVREPEPPQDRGLLSLSARESWGVGRRDTFVVNSSEATSNWYLYFSASLDLTLPRISQENQSTGHPERKGAPYLELHPFGANYGYNASDTISSILYLHTLEDTNSPALALQTLLTKLSQTWFYTSLPLLFYYHEKAEIASSSLTFLPTRNRGLLCGVAILAGHLVLVFLITAFFLIGTQRSFIGHSWPAVSQVRENSLVAGVMKGASDLRDDDVRKWVKERAAKEDLIMTVRRRKV